MNDRANDDIPSIERLDVALDVTYAWGYEEARSELRDLYVRAAKAQWNADTALDWSVDVDPQKQQIPDLLHPLADSDFFHSLTPKERHTLMLELNAWSLSQFLHGEQGALLAASQLVTSLQTVDGKLYSASQVVDEARHVDVYNRYLREKIGFSFPISVHLKTILDLILRDSRWDIKVLGMQIMVEGLALAAFGMTRKYSTEPLIVAITRNVMRDEARHVAFGTISLRELYAGMSDTERGEREDFVYETARLMRDRFLYEEVWDKMGFPVEKCKEITLNNKAQKVFRQMLFSRIVPAIKHIGLLSARQRARFDDMDILRFEDAIDPFARLDRVEDEGEEATPPTTNC